MQQLRYLYYTLFCVTFAPFKGYPVKVFYGCQQGSAHLSLACLEKYMNEQHSVNDVIEVEADGTETKDYCHLCCPEVLWTPEVLHTRCRECGQEVTRPCRHTGVKILRRAESGRSVFPRRWPEKVRGAPIADLPEQS